MPTPPDTIKAPVEKPVEEVDEKIVNPAPLNLAI
jgi:hypothetical protein